MSSSPRGNATVSSLMQHVSPAPVLLRVSGPLSGLTPYPFRMIVRQTEFFRFYISRQIYLFNIFITIIK